MKLEPASVLATSHRTRSFFSNALLSAFLRMSFIAGKSPKAAAWWRGVIPRCNIQHVMSEVRPEVHTNTPARAGSNVRNPRPQEALHPTTSSAHGGRGCESCGEGVTLRSLPTHGPGGSCAVPAWVAALLAHGQGLRVHPLLTSWRV